MILVQAIKSRQQIKRDIVVKTIKKSVKDKTTTNHSLKGADKMQKYKQPLIHRKSKARK